MTSQPAHTDLAGGRWHTFSLMTQLANVGSEVERAIRAHSADRFDRRDRAIERALELFDLTAVDPRWRGHRRREILRMREFFCGLFYHDFVASIAAALQRDFEYFAIAAKSGIPPKLKVAPLEQVLAELDVDRAERA